ncbi:MAG: threonine synthase [Candidatus Methanoperedens sp.]|nr:threonine synthase [Candidatus Methanoperedens sp.]MCZ7371875.1 threonine synthase [Candidatus Methanoperedens sp.]
MGVLKCRDCGTLFPEALITSCSECYGPVDTCIEDIDRSIKSKIESRYPSMWRYLEFLPLNDTRMADLNDGWTSLLRSNRLGEIIGIKNLHLKFEGTNPTQSYEDRSVSISINKAIEFNSTAIGCASTHYIADSVAAHAAKTGLKSYIFVPDTTPTEIISPLLLYGAQVLKVYRQEGDIDCQCHGNDPATCTLVTRIAEKPELGLPIVDLDLRTYFNSGYKTLSYEIAEQLGWKSPDNIVIPEGSGSLTYNMYLGFKELYESALIEDLPKFFIVQSSGCAPIVDALVHRKEMPTPLRNPMTLCENLRVGDPADGLYALRVIKDGGYGIAIEDKEGVEYAELIAKKEGIFPDFSGGLAVAGLVRLCQDNRISPTEKTVVVIPASGIKNRDYCRPDWNLNVPRISSDIAELQSYLEKEKVNLTNTVKMVVPEKLL